MAAERNNDDIAAALHGLSAGDASDTSHGTRHGSAHGEADHVTSSAPISESNSENAKPASGGKRPSTPPARPAGPPAAPAPAKPLTSSRPAVPGARRASPSDLPPAPLSIEDDTDSDATIAPSLDYRGPTRRSAPVRARRTPLFKSLGFRRTIIPVLLTTGLMMIAFGAARWVVDKEAPLALLHPGICITLIAVGGLLMFLAVVNMLLVRNELAAKRGSGASAVR